MSLNQNQFALESIKGTKVHGGESQVMSVQFYSATATDVIAPGEFVILDSLTPAGSMPRVKVGADQLSAYFGVVLTNPIIESFGVGEKCEIGILGSVVTCEVDAALNVGVSVAYDPSSKKITTHAGSEKVVGILLEKSAADGDLVRVLVRA
jgi:hypothetical protein